MRLTTMAGAAVIGTMALSSTASADIVKAPAGPASELKPSSQTRSVLKRNKVKLRAVGSARLAGSTLTVPYSLARWDFQTREGDIAHFARNTGFQLRRGRRTTAMVHPRVIVEGGTGYITALIAGVRVKTFTFRLSSGNVAQTGGRQRITGLRLKLTKASADYLNRGLRRKVLRRYSQFGTLNLVIAEPAGTGSVISAQGAPGQGDNPGATLRAGSGLLGVLPAGAELRGLSPTVGVDTNGDGVADSGVFGLPLSGGRIDATSRTGTVQLNGGMAVRLNGQDLVTLDDPQVVLGTTAEASGLFATVNGVRTRVGTFDPSTLNLNVADGTVTVTGLDVKAAPGVVLPGVGLLPAGQTLFTLDLSAPQA